MTHDRSRAITGLFATGVLALSACSSTGSVQPYAKEAKVDCAGKQNLTASGSTAQANAMTRFIKTYQDVCPGKTLNYTANGSGAGVSDFSAAPPNSLHRRARRGGMGRQRPQTASGRTSLKQASFDVTIEIPNGVM